MDFGTIDELIHLEETARGKLSEIAPWQILFGGHSPHGSIYLLGNGMYMEMRVDGLSLVPADSPKDYPSDLPGFIRRMSDDPSTFGFIPAYDSVSLTLYSMGLEHMMPLVRSYTVDAPGTMRDDGYSCLIYLPNDGRMGS